jgi:hypothetical protein
VCGALTIERSIEIEHRPQGTKARTSSLGYWGRSLPEPARFRNVELIERRILMNQEENPIQLDLSVETLALLGRNQPDGQTWTDSIGLPRCCGGSGSECTPPTCCP